MLFKLKVERFDKDHQLLEKRNLISKSLTQGFIEALYIQMANVLSGSPYPSGFDVDLNPLNMNTDLFASSYYQQTIMKVAGPSGDGVIPSSANSMSALISLRGNDMGIILGAGNTAVTPQDRRLVQRFGHGNHAPDGVDTLYNNYQTGDTAGLTIYDVNWYAQNFIADQDFTISSLSLKLFKTGAPPNPLTVSIVGCKRGGPPRSNNVLSTTTVAAASLGASPGAFVTIPLVTPVDLYKGHMYAIQLSTLAGTAGNSYGWRYNNASTYFRSIGYDNAASKLFSGTTYASSTNSGTTWAMQNTAVTTMFACTGRSRGELEHSGTVIRPPVFANPNGSFDIYRYFYNNCGVALTVQEIGLTAIVPGDTDLTFTGYAYLLQARDVVAPIVLNNGQLLLVTYTPSITV